MLHLSQEQGRTDLLTQCRPVTLVVLFVGSLIQSRALLCFFRHSLEIHTSFPI